MDVPLLDEDTGVVNGLGKSKLEHLGLQPALQEVLNLETKNVIQLHPVIRQNTSPDKPPEEGIALKEPLGVLLLESEQLTSSGPDQGQAVLDAPYLTLVPQTVLSNELQLLVKTSLLKRPPWSTWLGSAHCCGRLPSLLLLKRVSCRSESSNK